MKLKDVATIGGAAVAVFLLLRVIAPAKKPVQYWAVEQGNTGYPQEAKTGGGVWI